MMQFDFLGDDGYHIIEQIKTLSSNAMVSEVLLKELIENLDHEGRWFSLVPHLMAPIIYIASIFEIMREITVSYDLFFFIIILLRESLIFLWLLLLSIHKKIVARGRRANYIADWSHYLLREYW